MPRVHASQVASTELAPLLAELAPELRYAYLETVTDRTWARYATDLPFGQALRGRVFGPDCELQFQRADAGFRITLLTDTPRATTLVGPTLDLALTDREDVTYLLWGSYAETADAWIEPGFRQPWHYPIEGRPSRVGVQAIEYRDRASGDLHMVRYLDLVPVEAAE